MIINKAYSGKKFVHRVYYNGQLIWDHGTYSHGNAFATLKASIMPYLRNQDTAQMCVEAIMDGFGIAEVSELEAIVARTDMLLKNKVIPHVSKAIHGAGTEFVAVQVSIAPFTFDIVYGCGDAMIELAAYGYANEAVSVHGLGVVNVDVIDSLCPTVEDVIQILASSEMNINGFTMPMLQEPEQIVADLPSNFVSNCSPTTLPTHTVTFVRDGVELYKTKVVHGHDCHDPIDSGEIKTPTKAMTPQYTYEFSGWSLADDGEADVGGIVTLLEEQSIVGFEDIGGGSWYLESEALFPPFIEGVDYKIVWNGTEYTCTAALMDGVGYVGNTSLADPPIGEDTGEPFIIMVVPGALIGVEFDILTVLTNQEGTSHTIAIYQETSGALGNIIKDTVIYAAFTASVRYYTVTFYDDDGVTVLKTQSLAYGTKPSSYTPTKANYIFNSWYPEVAEVTGDISYYAVWEEKVSFATAPWSKIAEISAAGDATKHFALGNSKDITLSNGIVVTLQIIGFNHDDLADGSGKAGITLLSKYILTGDIYSKLHSSTTRVNWSDCYLRNYLNGNFINTLPEEFANIVKPVTKVTTITGYRNTSTHTTSDKFWLLSGREVGYASMSSSYVGIEGTRYAMFSSASSYNYLDNDLNKKTREGTIAKYYLRTPYNSSSLYYANIISGTSSYYAQMDSAAAYISNAVGNNYGMVFGCCI